MSFPVSVSHTIVCDDIRQEMTGKLIYIGVYIDDIQARTFPAAMHFAFAINGKSHRVDSMDFKFRIEFIPEDEALERYEDEKSLTAHFENPELERDVVYVLTKVPVRVAGPGEMVLSVDGDNWREVARKKIVLKPPIDSPISS